MENKNLKIQLVSDLHLEFGDLTLPGGDVLILAGDILEAKNLKKSMYDPNMVLLPHERPDRRPDRYYRFFAEECSKYREVVMVMGNHEHYHGKIWKTQGDLLANLPDNVTLLENQTHEIDGVMFVGATLWTDFNKGNPQVMMNCQFNMSDYKFITQFDSVKNAYYKLTPNKTYLLHQESCEYIKKTLQKNQDRKVVVVTHMAPSVKSVAEEYNHDVLINPAYYSNLEGLIESNPQIKYWCHGHTHTKFDYQVGSTRVLCNPRGYNGYEETAINYEPVEIEV